MLVSNYLPGERRWWRTEVRPCRDNLKVEYWKWQAQDACHLAMVYPRVSRRLYLWSASSSEPLQTAVSSYSSCLQCCELVSMASWGCLSKHILYALVIPPELVLRPNAGRVRAVTSWRELLGDVYFCSVSPSGQCKLSSKQPDNIKIRR